MFFIAKRLVKTNITLRIKQSNLCKIMNNVNKDACKRFPCHTLLWEQSPVLLLSVTCYYMSPALTVNSAAQPSLTPSTTVT